MTYRLFFAALLFTGVLTALTAFLFLRCSSFSGDGRSEQLLAANEIEQLAKNGETELLIEKAEALTNSIRNSENNIRYNIGLVILGAFGALEIAAVFLYIYFSVLRPFDKLKAFAEKVSAGNFDIALDYRRINYFGAFTWAFDSMRTEITKARRGEREAAENNKTVIATLSHDIKTPIASIRAYGEALEANMDTTAEKRSKYISVIISKCDEVARLTNDLFLHSVSDMDKLKMKPEELELSGFLEKAVKELSTESSRIIYKKTNEDIIIRADKNRLLQLTENIINNAVKYAKTEIEITAAAKGRTAEIRFRDYGGGIPDEDMPFVFGKFYRGKNCGSEQGSGLGLYIVKYIAEKSGGTVRLHNHSDGLEVAVELPRLQKAEFAENTCAEAIGTGSKSSFSQHA